MFLTEGETDEIGLRMIRLDPLQRHASVAGQAVRDLAGLWSAYDDAGKLNVAFAESMLPLKASAERLEALRERLGGEVMLLGGDDGGYRRRRVIPDPGEAVAGDPFIRGVVQFVVMSTIRSD